LSVQTVLDAGEWPAASLDVVAHSDALGVTAILASPVAFISHADARAAVVLLKTDTGAELCRHELGATERPSCAVFLPPGTGCTLAVGTSVVVAKGGVGESEMTPEGRLLLFEWVSGRGLSLVASHATGGAVGAVCVLGDDTVVVGAGKRVKVYSITRRTPAEEDGDDDEVGERKDGRSKSDSVTVTEVSDARRRGVVTSVAALAERRIAVGDNLDGVGLYEYGGGVGVGLRLRCNDPHTRMVVGVCFGGGDVDPDSVWCIDLQGDFFVLRWPPDQNTHGGAAHHGQFVPAVTQAVVDAVYSTGSQCRRICPLACSDDDDNGGGSGAGAGAGAGAGGLAAAVPRSASASVKRTRAAIMSTTGGLTVVSALTRSEYSTLSAISVAMETHASPIASPLLGNSVRMLRSQMQPCLRVIDGDYVALFLELSRDLQAAVASAAGCGASAESVVELVESLQAQGV
jgi:hypothetical protein